jgi:hypothetical protein
MEYSIDMAKSVLTMYISSNRLQRGNYRFLLKVYPPSAWRAVFRRAELKLKGAMRLTSHSNRIWFRAPIFSATGDCDEVFLGSYSCKKEV